MKKEIWVKPKTIMTYIIYAIDISHSLEGNGCIEESIPFDIEKRVRGHPGDISKRIRKSEWRFSNCREGKETPKPKWHSNAMLHGWESKDIVPRTR